MIDELYLVHDKARDLAPCCAINFEWNAAFSVHISENLNQNSEGELVIGRNDFFPWKLKISNRAPHLTSLSLWFSAIDFLSWNIFVENEGQHWPQCCLKTFEFYGFDFKAIHCVDHRETLRIGSYSNVEKICYAVLNNGLGFLNKIPKFETMNKEKLFFVSCGILCRST